MKRNLHSYLLALSLLMALAAGHSVSGQVIVNGGFEDLLALPTTTGQWSLASGWASTGSSENSPDVFHIQGAGGGDLPETPVALVSPYQGMAVAGFMACGAGGTNRREYLSGTFSSPLNVGARYRLTFRMTSGELTPFSEGGLGIGELGMHFSMGPLQQQGANPMTELPHFELSPVFFSREWETISFTFVADAAWTHFTWGAFGADADRTIEVIEGNQPSMAYCFVDDFSLVVSEGEMTQDEVDVRGPDPKPVTDVIDLETEPAWFVPNAFTPNDDGENDVFLPVWKNLTMLRFEVYSRWGELVYELRGESNGWDGQSFSNEAAAAGLYIWQMELQDADGMTISESGAINLIR